MDRSVNGYLKMRTTEELCGILNYCLKADNFNSYEYVILEILKILGERLPLEELSPSVMRYLTTRLQAENKEKHK